MRVKNTVQEVLFFRLLVQDNKLSDINKPRYIAVSERLRLYIGVFDLVRVTGLEPVNNNGL